MGLNRMFGLRVSTLVRREETNIGLVRVESKVRLQRGLDFYRSRIEGSLNTVLFTEVAAKSRCSGRDWRQDATKVA
jgi:hypothetical protein